MLQHAFDFCDMMRTATILRRMTLKAAESHGILLLDEAGRSMPRKEKQTNANYIVQCQNVNFLA